MPESESALLQRFVSAGDAGAFAEIVHCYAGLVYGTCIRILADTDKAADATQETFFQLTKKAGEIRGSLAGWLHRVALRKAVDLTRDDSARRRRERQYIDAKPRQDQTWQEVSPYVDAALNQLDDQTRDLLVRHYLEGRSMTDLAGEFDVSRPTISRRIESGLEHLRALLRRRGVLVTAAGLSALLAENTAQSTPPALLQQLGKMALLGAEAVPVAASASSSSVALAGGVIGAAKTKFVAAAVAAVVVGAALVTYKSLSSKPPPVAPPVSAPDRDERRPRAGEITDEPEGPALPEATIETPEAPMERAMAESVERSPQAGAPKERVVEPLPLPVDRASETSGFQLDLSSPEATVRSFVKAMVAGDAESVLACFLPGGTDYDDARKMVEADVSDPEYDIKVALQSLDPDAEMPVLITTENPNGSVKIVWEVAFKSDVTIEGHTFHAGDTMPMDSLLVPSGHSWLIDNM